MNSAGAAKTVVLAGAPAGLLRGGASLLASAGYVVLPVETYAALEALGEGHLPDLVILDVAFSAEGALVACRRLREKPVWRFVSMMLVVPAGEPHLEECLVPGLNDFMLAPFPGDELLDKVRRLTVIPARRELNTIAKVREGRPDGAALFGKTLNVSATGVLVEIESLIGVGRRVEIEFFLPGDSVPLRASARVMRRTVDLDLFHPAFGLHFEGISAQDAARIDSFVAKREHVEIPRPVSPAAEPPG
jgi:CheY-like chemotaxis protein